MSRFVRIAVSLVGVLVGGVGVRVAGAGDHAFYHENVMGTSLELRVRAVDEAAGVGLRTACSGGSIA